MFYQTQISKIGVGGAIDTQGKRLRFCGNLPVSEGDWVWTDGAVIFGHVPIRDTPLLPSIDSGIPAAFSNSKGYFSQVGRFKKYPIAVDDATPNWIVNGKRKYFHSDTSVFDAEISINNEGIEDGLFTAELAVSNYDNVALYYDDNGEILNDDAIVIKKDGTEISRVYLHDYIQAIDKAQEIAARGSSFYNEQSFSSAYVQLINFELHTDGSWDALIASSAHVELRSEYKSYVDGGVHDVGEDTRRGWKIVKSDPENVYFGKAYAERNYLVLFNSTDTFDDMVLKMREKFAELGFDVQGDFENAVAQTARGVGDVATIWDFGDNFVDIDPPANTSYTERIIHTYYLVHTNSKGITKVLNEYADANAWKIYDDERYIFDEIPASENDIDFFLSVYNNNVDLPITHILGQALGLTDPFAVRPEIFDVTSITYWNVSLKKPVIYEDDAINIKRYDSYWTYPLQDDYFCQMNFWRILNVYDPDGNAIVINLAQSSNDAEQKIDLRIPEFQYVREDFDTVRWFIENGFQLPYIILPAVAPLKNGGYLIGVPQHEIYKVDATGIAQLITDKNVLANLRLRYMPNISKARH